MSIDQINQINLLIEDLTGMDQEELDRFSLRQEEDKLSVIESILSIINNPEYDETKIYPIIFRVIPPTSEDIKSELKTLSISDLLLLLNSLEKINNEKHIQSIKKIM
jgi:hypothetical protein